jgi:autotransporter-associated beta strand protein
LRTASGASNAFFSGLEIAEIQSGGLTIDVTTEDIVVSQALSGPGTFTKSGGNEVTLNGNNTFSGGSVLSAGTLALAHDSALGSGTITIDGGTLAGSGGSRTLANAIAVNNDFTIGGAVALTLSGTVNLGSLSRTVTVDNSGTTTFSSVLSGTVDADTGTQIWSNPDVLGVSDIHLWVEPAHTLTDGGPRIPERRYLLVSTGTTGLWALNPEDGTEEWHRRLPLGGVSQPVPIAGALMVNTTQMGVFLVSPIDGSLIDGIHLASGSSSTPAAHGTRAYVVSDHGRLLGLHVTPPLKRPRASTLPPI